MLLGYIHEKVRPNDKVVDLRSENGKEGTQGGAAASSKT